jgi:hypothetical protein
MAFVQTKVFEMEHESFIRETEIHLRNAKSRFISAEINAQVNDTSDSN